MDHTEEVDGQAASRKPIGLIGDDDAADHGESMSIESTPQN